jgi:hypothetical protein
VIDSLPYLNQKKWWFILHIGACQRITASRTLNTLASAAFAGK